MFNLSIKRKRIALFSNRTKLRVLNYQIEKASYGSDAALVEELMEEKRRFIESLF